MSAATLHRPPCVSGDHCGESSACPPEFPSDAQGPAQPVSAHSPIDLDAVEREIASTWGADRTTCRALVAEIRRLTVRPATDPTNLAGLVKAPRHLAPFQSFEAERAEYAAVAYGIVRDHLGRHVAEDVAA